MPLPNSKSTHEKEKSSSSSSAKENERRECASELAKPRHIKPIWLPVEHTNTWRDVLFSLEWWRNPASIVALSNFSPKYARIIASTESNEERKNVDRKLCAASARCTCDWIFSYRFNFKTNWTHFLGMCVCVREGEERECVWLMAPSAHT